MKIIPPLRDPEVLRSDYKAVLKIADDFTTGGVGILGASRAMCRVQYFIDAQDDPNFKLFTKIAESSWHLPIGSDREFSAYTGTDEELKAEIEKLECKYQSAAIAATENLVKKYRALIEPQHGADPSQPFRSP